MAQGTDDRVAVSVAHTLPLSPLARPDVGREARRGIPEVILASSKSAEQVIVIAASFLDLAGQALVSRIPATMLADVLAALPEAQALYYPLAQALRLRKPDFVARATAGHVGVITAGTSDIPTAEEARFIAEAMGCTVTTLFDVGVAGAHRLFGPLEALAASGVDAIVVAAGMDGALPSLVAGLVPVPVIGLPTPIGYGAGGNGEAALLSMLQSCAPGLVVVNIGNGIGAGSVAALIANRAAEARRAPLSPVASSTMTAGVTPGP